MTLYRSSEASRGRQPTSTQKSPSSRPTRPIQFRHPSEVPRKPLDLERDADALHEMGHHDLRLGRLVVDRGTVHSVAARRIAAVGPVKDTVLVVELDINRFRQPIEEDLDV
jgi:hypothetical protein